MSAIEELAAQRLLPVLRCADAVDAIGTGRAAAAAGCRVVEVTMSTPAVQAAIGPLVDDGLLVAVGTVRDAADVPRLARPEPRSSSRSGIRPASSRPRPRRLQGSRRFRAASPRRSWRPLSPTAHRP